MTGATEGPKRRAVWFPLADLSAQIEAFAVRWPTARADRAGEAFGGEGAALHVPLLAPRLSPGELIADYRARLPGAPETAVVLLLQAGAMAFGCWRGVELLRHKAVRKYVVRGHGRAQPLHLKTAGRSRQGSRLRLQNWQRLLVETNERLRDCWRDLGTPDRVFVAIPVRVWSDLAATDPRPPFARGDANVQRVPTHVHRPDFAELQRVHSWLAHGRLELTEP
jgi:hypothetical protein